jgi:hypothetical protein
MVKLHHQAVMYKPQMSTDHHESRLGI